MYLSLYRKYRPATFADVVGQDAVTRTLRGQIRSGHIGHAYLFTGTRGTGKTTCAKIFAKAVNCEHPVDGDPCGECPSCQAIAGGQVTDIYEIDAASNSRVDDVRELKADVIYTPALVKYKVYIIDEVHRLSGSAFDALLKTVEEPPEHVIFILATTELHKVPSTILSRCQRFDFRRIDTADIRGRLQSVAQAEGLTLTDDAAQMLARMGRGSMRDALSFLERASAAGGDITGETVGDLLGLCDPERLMDCVEKIADGDIKGVMEFLDAMWRSSKDIARLLTELSVLFRDILLIRAAPALTEERSPQERRRLAEMYDKLGQARILSCLEILQKGVRDAAVNGGERVMTEITLMRLCDPKLSTDPAGLAARIEALENRAPAPAEHKAPTAKTEKPTARPADPEPQPPAEKTERPEKPEKPAVPPDKLWRQALEILRSDGRQDLVGTLSSATPKIEGGRVIFSLPDGFTRRLLGTEQNRAAIADALKRVDRGDYFVKFEDPAPAPQVRDALDDLIDNLNKGENV